MNDSDELIIPENTMCGPVSLYLIGRKLQMECTLKEIAVQVDLGPRGCSLSSLAQAAEKMGLEAVPYQIASPGQLAWLSDRTPAIILLRENHFAVVWGESESSIRLAEYPHPVKTISPKELEGRMDTRILVVTRPGEQENLFPSAGFPLFLPSLILLLPPMVAVGWVRLRRWKRKVNQGCGAVPR